MDWIMVCIAAVFMLFFGGIYVGYTPSYGKKVLPFKGIATLMALIPALVLEGSGRPFVRWIMVAGIIFCVAADIFLDVYFVAGAMLFAAAHICFLIAYVQYTSPMFYTVMIWVVLCAVFILSYRRWMKKLEKLLFPAMVYVVLLSAMCAMAITAAASLKCLWGLWAAAGGILFAASDYILVGSFLNEKMERRNTEIILGLYYAAVFALGVFAGLAG